MIAPPQRPEIIAHCRLLADSYHHWTKQPLIAGVKDDAIFAQLLYEAPFVLVSHGTERDPIFNYANLCAQNLWKLPWDQFTALPSRKSAEPIEESLRQELMMKAKEKGCINNYQGVRISSEGKRFYIIDVTLWNVINSEGQYLGQAAKFDHWEFI